MLTESEVERSFRRLFSGKEVTEEMFAGKVERKEDGGHGNVEWAVLWGAAGFGDADGFTHSYCNTVPTQDGGTDFPEPFSDAVFANAPIGIQSEMTAGTFELIFPVPAGAIGNVQLSTSATGQAKLVPEPSTLMSIAIAFGAWATVGVRRRLA